MKQGKLATTLFVGLSLLSSIAFAGGLSDEDILVVENEPYDWTGYYAGLNAGIVKHTLSMTDNNASSFNATIQEVANPKFTGGFQLGYRYQMDPDHTSAVYGAEFSANFSNATFSKTYGSPFALYQLNAENQLKTVCLLELLGGIAADRTLLFLSAGLSWSKIDGSTTNTDSIPFFDSFSVAQKALGTTIGGGIEYAFNDQFSARFKVDVVTPRTYTTSDDIDNHFQISNSIVQGTFGINYRFG